MTRAHFVGLHLLVPFQLSAMLESAASPNSGTPF
jgi:hypothetical protein